MIPLVYILAMKIMQAEKIQIFRKLQNVRPIIKEDHNLKFINCMLSMLNTSEPGKQIVDILNTKIIYS